MSKSRAFFVLLLIAIIMMVALYSQNYFNLPGEHATEIEEPYGDTVVTLTDYKVYDLVDVPFRFILADIKVTNIRPINFELSRFQTDERIQLSSIDEYRTEITRRGYDLGSVNVVNQLASNEIELDAKILIPVTNIYRQMMVVNISGIKTDRLVFDLSKNLGSASDLGVTVTIDETDIVEPTDPVETEIENPEEPIETQISNTMQVLSANMINKDLILYKGLEGYHRVDFGNQVRILLVGVTFDYENDVSLSAARIYFPESDELFFALPPEYVVENGNNVLNKVVRQESGSLIFQIDDRQFNPLNQPYRIEVRFAETKNWVTIPMNTE